VAKRTILAANGTDRLVVSTICTHFMFFHEAGFQFRTERRNGWRWIASDAAVQPINLRCSFNDRDDPESFGATSQTTTGFYKLSCDHMFARTHCVDVVRGGATLPEPDLGRDARSVRDVQVQLAYDGQELVLRHRS
jgi:hypothetical protein